MTSRRKMVTCAECDEFRRAGSRGLCNRCYQRRCKLGAALPPLVRDVLVSFEERMARAQAAETSEGCWPWDGFITPQGYGQVRRNEGAHRAAWAWDGNELPEFPDMQLDHTCHSRDLSCAGGPTCPHRRCVNPNHLEPVPAIVNARRGVLYRGSTCQAGHPKIGAHGRRDELGRWVCNTCSREYQRERAAPRTVRGRGAPYCGKGVHGRSAEHGYVRSDGTWRCDSCLEDGRARRNARARERDRLRYATDPAFRARKIERAAINARKRAAG